MNRRNLLFSGMMAFTFAFAAAAQTESSKLTAKVSDTGSGTVDDSHKVYVVLWDTPDFMKDDASGIMPIDVKVHCTQLRKFTFRGHSWRVSGKYAELAKEN